MRGYCLTLLIFGLVGLIGSSDGFKCYVCNNIPLPLIGIEGESCKDPEVAPDQKTLKECDGKMSPVVSTAISAAATHAPEITGLYSNLTQGGDKPACILITGKYQDTKVVVRECASVTDEILKTKCLKFEAAGAGGEACACTSDGCNGKKTSMSRAGSIQVIDWSKILISIIAILVLNKM